jgi:NADH-quinone oxidoreductase subunit C
MSAALVELVKKTFPQAIVETHAQRGDDTVVVEASAWHAVMQFLRDDPRSQCDMLIDLSAADYPDREPRFEVVTHLLSLRLGHRLRMKTRVGTEDGEDAVVDSVSDLWASANWCEREVWDMFGIKFANHPDLRRILMYNEFEGYPLRKDYPADRIQPLVPYRDAPNIEKLPPFSADEGMSFGRQTHQWQENDAD